jgi:hypothetical protein
LLSSPATSFGRGGRRAFSTVQEEPKLKPKLPTNAILPFTAFLTDTFGRQHTYLRISLTEKCNLR